MLTGIGLVFTDGWSAYAVGTLLFAAGALLLIRSLWPPLFIRIEEAKLIEGIPEKRQESLKAWTFCSMCSVFLWIILNASYWHFKSPDKVQEIFDLLRTTASEVHQIASARKDSDVPAVRKQESRDPEVNLPHSVTRSLAVGNLHERVADLSREIASFASERQSDLERWEVYGPWQEHTSMLFKMKYLPRVISIRDECRELHTVDPRLNQDLQMVLTIQQVYLSKPNVDVGRYSPSIDEIKEISDRLAVLSTEVK